MKNWVWNVGEEMLALQKKVIKARSGCEVITNGARAQRTSMFKFSSANIISMLISLQKTNENIRILFVRTIFFTSHFCTLI